MINHLRHMAIFAQVVEKGSFRAAANELKLAPSRVSQTISDLEQYLGVTLLHRTTRKLSLTSDGNKFYSHVADMIKNAESGLNEINAHAQKPIGEMKISLPAFLESSCVSSVLADFAKQYSEISLSLIYTDHPVDIISENLDLSIRANVLGLQDSSMMSRKFGQMKRLLVAGKEYVEKQSIPQHPNDLSNWDWISFHMRPNTIELTSTSGETVNISGKTRLSANSAGALRNFASKNLGATVLPINLAYDRINKGELVHVLKDWTLKPMSLYAIWPDKSRRKNLTMLLVNFLAESGLDH